MSEPASGSAELDQALEALDTMVALTGEGRVVFDGSSDRRLALAFLWVNVGSALKQFCRATGIAQGSSPFPGPIGLRDRLCYQRAGDLSPRILWDTCSLDAGPLVALLTDLRRALGGND
ncbi:MAG: hypothetical protein ACRD0J_10145 [Acidimicrobiales bacterium]